MSTTPKGLRSLDGANLNVLTWVAAAGEWRANSGCFLLVKFNTSSDFFLSSSPLASILVRRAELGFLVNKARFCDKWEVEYERTGDSWAMAGISVNSCEYGFTRLGLIGVDSCKGVGTASVVVPDITLDESGVGGNSVTSLSEDLRRRSDCLLFWNQICTAFSDMLTLLAMSVLLVLLGVDPSWNSWFKIDNS